MIYVAALPCDSASIKTVLLLGMVEFSYNLSVEVLL